MSSLYNGGTMNLRRATHEDLSLLVRVDLADEGVTPGYRDGWGNEDFLDHRDQMMSFLVDSDKGGIVADLPDDPSIGLIMWRLRNLERESLGPMDVFSQVRAVLPPNGSFCEIFQLWVDPRFRRKGIGRALKLSLEDAARERGAQMVYTHTEAQNIHVIRFNLGLGYREVRRGPIWDDVIRVSLVKELQVPPDCRNGE